MQYIEVEAPDEQLMLYNGSTVDAASTWRAGLDQHPAIADIEKLAVLLLAQEREYHQVNLEFVYGSYVLVAQHRLKEGEIAFNHSCLHFSSKAAAQRFLADGGNGALLQGASLWWIKGIKISDGTTRDLYLVPVGRSRYLQDCRKAGKKQKPNVELRITPGLGPNDGFAQWIIATHSGQGMSRGRWFLCDFGAHFVEDVEWFGESGAAASTPKKMKTRHRNLPGQRGEEGRRARIRRGSRIVRGRTSPATS